MDLGSIFLIFALALGVSWFVSRPFFNRQAAARLVDSAAKASVSSQNDHKRSTLLAERDRVLSALQELDFDYSVGKVPEEDYPAQRAMLLEAGTTVLRELDELQKETHAKSTGDRLEAAIAARRGDARDRPRLPSADQDDLEKLIASRRRARQEKSAGFCPKCGRPLQKSDLFCSSCGAPISS